jgi:hypothetical protein
MKVYIDCCPLRRLTDYQSQHRVREEADAVEVILELVASGHIEWISSPSLQIEMPAPKDESQRLQGMALLN